MSLKLAFGTESIEEDVLPVARWQARQWQLKVTSGLPEKAYLIAPQAQPPAVWISDDSIMMSPFALS